MAHEKRRKERPPKDKRPKEKRYRHKGRKGRRAKEWAEGRSSDRPEGGA